MDDQRFRRIAATVYILGCVFSWWALYGMSNAYWYHEFPTLRSERECRSDAGFSAIWAAGTAVIWPLMLPGTYVALGFGQDGHMTMAECLHAVRVPSGSPE